MRLGIIDLISLYLVLWWNISVSQSNSCKQNHGYVLINGICTECPVGLYGVNCSQSCPHDHHGVKCEEQCNCPDNEFCHPTLGCVQLLPNGTIVDNFNETSKNETCPIPVPDQLYGIAIQGWFWISVILLGSNILILMACCCMCSSIKGCKPDEYHPKQMFDFLKMLVEARDHGQEGTSAQEENQNVATAQNEYIEDYSEILEMLPAPPPPPLPSTSFGGSDCDYMEPRVTKILPNIQSKSTNGTPNENAGYNSLTLRNNSTLPLNQEYAMVTPKSERVKGKAGVNGKVKGKSKLETLKQFGGRISDMFTTERPSSNRVQIGFDNFRPVVENNIYTVEGNEIPAESFGQEIPEVDALPRENPIAIEGHEYRVLEPQTGYNDNVSENETRGTSYKEIPFQYDFVRNPNSYGARENSNLTPSGAFLLSISSDQISDYSAL